MADPPSMVFKIADFLTRPICGSVALTIENVNTPTRIRFRHFPTHRKQEQIWEAQNASVKPFTFVQYAEVSLYGDPQTI
jgi:hypothetical protein